MKKTIPCILALVLFLATAVRADVVTLDFTGLQNYEYIQNYYNGGAGSFRQRPGSKLRYRLRQRFLGPLGC